MDYLTMEKNYDINLHDCLEIVIDNYFKNQNWISVVDLNDEEFFFPRTGNILLRKNENFTKASFVEDNVIILTDQNNIENVLKNIFRNFRTKFIVVTNEENILNVTNSFWKNRILFLLILVPKKNVIDILTYSPFRVQDCSEITTPKLLNKYNPSSKKLENPWADLKDVDNLIIDFMKSRINISFMDFPPFVIRDRSKTEITHMEGIEGNMITAIASKLNFTPEFINRHESEWGKFEPIPTGLLGDLYTGRSDIGFGVLYPFPERYVKLDGAIAYSLQEVTTWVVPVDAGSDIPVWLANIISEFTLLTWFSIIITFILTILFFRFLNKVNSKFSNQQPIPSAMFFLTAILIGQSQPQFSSTNRFFILTWIWFGFVIMSVYQSAMSSRVTAPSPPSNIKTFEQLLRSKLEMTGPFLGLKVVKMAAEDKDEFVLKKLYEWSKPTNISINDALLRIAKERNMAYFHHVAIFEYFEAINREVTGKVYIVDEGVYPHYPAILFPKHSFLVEYVNGIIGRLNDAGLVEKWAKDFKLVAKVRGQVRLRSLNIGDMFGALLIIMIGWLLAIFIFILELLMGKLFTNKIKITDRIKNAIDS